MRISWLSTTKWIVVKILARRTLHGNDRIKHVYVTAMTGFEHVHVRLSLSTSDQRVDQRRQFLNSASDMKYLVYLVMYFYAFATAFSIILTESEKRYIQIITESSPATSLFIYPQTSLSAELCRDKESKNFDVSY